MNTHADQWVLRHERPAAAGKRPACVDSYFMRDARAGAFVDCNFQKEKTYLNKIMIFLYKDEISL